MSRRHDSSIAKGRTCRAIPHGFRSVKGESVSLGLECVRISKASERGEMVRLDNGAAPHLRLIASLLLAWLVLGCQTTPPAEQSLAEQAVPREPIKLSDLKLKQIQIEDNFWAPRIETNRTKTLSHVYGQLEETGAIRNFDLAAGKAKGKFGGPWWSDSDVYKWLEGASHALANHPDPQLEAKVDEVIAKMAAAQRKDGYLDTFIQVVKPTYRWRNLGFFHEFFCVGHLFEAAVAHYEATGKRILLDLAVRFADHIDSTFGPDRKQGAPGHEEAELALVKLFRTTGEKRYLRLAQFFVDQRGQKPSVFEREYRRLPANETVELLGRQMLVRGFHERFFLAKPPAFDTGYCQDHLPVRQQSDAVGHAVRAMYLYSGMADLVYETGDKEMLEALRRLHDSVTLKRMYVTGGIGPSAHNEGFTDDYDLPNETAYQETCASIGLALWNHRMLKLTGDGHYGDLMELTLYNTLGGGVSLAGKSFCYVSPLYSQGDFQRSSWFGVPCCPTNLVRIMPSLGKFIYSQSEDGLWVNLYVGGKATVELPGGARVSVRQITNYPWEGEVKLEVDTETPQEFTIHLRIPGWARASMLRLNGREINPPVSGAYVHIRRRWSRGDTLELSLPMEIRKLEAHPNVAQDRGKVALQRGPLIYCLEQTDQESDLDQIILAVSAELQSRFEPGLLTGVVVITGQGFAKNPGGWDRKLYRPADPSAKRSILIRAVPYCVWGNREQGKMTVWISTS